MAAWTLDPSLTSTTHRRRTGTPRPALGSMRSTGDPACRIASGERLRDLRISVTDRCNFRCPYCMPAEVFGRDFAFLPKEQVLSFEEITRLASIFVGLGVHKLRITGGEPLVRRDLPELIRSIATLRTTDDQRVDLTLTTNGSALRGLAAPLAEAGLQRITVSLDSLDDEVFGAMNGVDFPVSRVLDGIAAARDAGLDADQGQHRRAPRDERGVDPAARPLGPRRRPDPALHRVHGRRALEWLAAGRRRAGGRDPGHHRRRVPPRARGGELPRRGGRSVPVPGRRRASSA